MHCIDPSPDTERMVHAVILTLRTALFLHHSLRTSETNYLQESYVFYDAIRERRYFHEISEMKK